MKENGHIHLNMSRYMWSKCECGKSLKHLILWNGGSTYDYCWNNQVFSFLSVHLVQVFLSTISSPERILKSTSQHFARPFHHSLCSYYAGCHH